MAKAFELVLDSQQSKPWLAKLACFLSTLGYLEADTQAWSTQCLEVLRLKATHIDTLVGNNTNDIL